MSGSPDSVNKELVNIKFSMKNMSSYKDEIRIKF